jgi:hypothetical protein
LHFPEAAGAGEDINALKSGVVAIASSFNGKHRSGTGIVVDRDRQGIYILTATHVVEGDPAPRVQFLAQRNTPLASEVIRMEGANPNGVAVLVVRTISDALKTVRRLSFTGSKAVRDGEQVYVIGFPQGGNPWSVVKAVISGRDGRDLVLSSGSLDEGSSGGPVVWKGAVIGMVTSTKGSFARAAPQELVGMVLESWGVDIEKESASNTEPKSAKQDLAMSLNGIARASVEKASCRSIDNDVFRIDLSGTVAGPEGSYFYLVPDTATVVLQRAELECYAWTTIATKPPQCQRQVTDAPISDWRGSYFFRGAEGPPNELLGHLLVSQARRSLAPEGTLRIPLRCD